MARINIEEEAWARIYRLAEIHGSSVREAAGTVTCLWHQSQAIVQTLGSKEDVLEWASLHNLGVDEQEKWLSSLKKARFISQEKNGSFMVRGNEIQIGGMVARLNKAHKGAKATKKKWNEIKRIRAGLEHATSTPQAGSDQANTIQDNTEQSRTKQSKTKQTIPKENESFLKAFLEYPVRTKGPDALKRFNEQIKSKEDFEKLVTAIAHYKKYLADPKNSWRKPKQSFAAYLGTKASGYFWHDWIESDSGKVDELQPPASDYSFLSKHNKEQHNDRS